LADFVEQSNKNDVYAIFSSLGFNLLLDRIYKLFNVVEFICESCIAHIWLVYLFLQEFAGNLLSHCIMLEREKTDERVHHMIHLASFAGQELGEAYSISLTNPRLQATKPCRRPEG
jgi:hypothetical protein